MKRQESSMIFTNCEHFNNSAFRGELSDIKQPLEKKKKVFTLIL